MNIFKPEYAGIDMIYVLRIHSKSLLLLSRATEITKEEAWYSFLLLCLKVSFLLFFSPKYKTKNLVHMLFLLSEFSPSVLALDVGHALQLSKIQSIFIKRNVPRSFWSSAACLGRDLIISVFVSSRMDGLNFFSI
jgi:hypothetical protein